MATPVDQAKAQTFAHRVVDFAQLDACVKYFDEKQVDFDLQEANGWTILMSCCAAGRDDLVELVLDRTTNVMAATVPNGTTVVHLAAMNRNFHVMEALLSSPARRAKLSKLINLPNANGDTPLMLACVAKNIVAVNLLVELGVDMNPRNCHNLTPLHCAVRVAPQEDVEMELLFVRSGEIVRMLLEAGNAQVNEVTLSGDTALHIAIQCQNHSAVGHLLAEKSLDLTMRNRANQTAIEIAKAVKCPQVLELVEKRWKELEDQSKALSQLLVDGNDNHESGSKPKKSAAKPMKSTRCKQQHQHKQKEAVSDKSTELDTRVEAELKPKQDDEDTHKSEIGSTAIQSSANEVDIRHIGAAADQDDIGEWQECKSKRSKRKEEDTRNAKPKHDKSSSRQTPPQTAKNKSDSHKRTPPHGNKPTTRSSIDEKIQQEPKDRVNTQPEKTQSDPSPRPQAEFCSNKPSPAPSQLQLQDVSTKSQPAVTSKVDEGSTGALTRDAVVQAKFEEQFPLAAEMEISVEKFVTLDMEELGDLSISQLETLQEAHLNAYQQLFKKKLELVGELENQRTQARFELEKDMLVFK